MPGVINDPIADLLTRVRNGLQARHSSVVLPHSKIKEVIGEILVKQGYIESVTRKAGDVQDTLEIVLKYTPERKPVIQGLKRVSKPGLRRYVAADSIPRVQGGLGIAILSTSRGLMTDSSARRSKVGGELLCEVW